MALWPCTHRGLTSFQRSSTPLQNQNIRCWRWKKSHRSTTSSQSAFWVTNTLLSPLRFLNAEEKLCGWCDLGVSSPPRSRLLVNPCRRTILHVDARKHQTHAFAMHTCWYRRRACQPPQPNSLANEQPQKRSPHHACAMGRMHSHWGHTLNDDDQWASHWEVRILGEAIGIVPWDTNFGKNMKSRGVGSRRLWRRTWWQSLPTTKMRPHLWSPLTLLKNSDWKPSILCAPFRYPGGTWPLQASDTPRGGLLWTRRVRATVRLPKRFRAGTPRVRPP